METEFEWSATKAAANAAKHGVRFEEALTVFQDPQARFYFDEDHSEEEHREIVVGYSKTGRLLLVCFTERPYRVVRIISARNVNRLEREKHEKRENS